jgi:hypothetical protein
MIDAAFHAPFLATTNTRITPFLPLLSCMQGFSYQKLLYHLGRLIEYGSFYDSLNQLTMENTYGASPSMLPDNSIRRIIDENTLMLAADANGRTTVYISSRDQSPNLISFRLPVGVEEGPPNKVAWLAPNSASDAYRLGLIELLVASRAEVDCADVRIRNVDNTWISLTVTSSGLYTDLLDLLLGDGYRVDNGESRAWELIVRRLFRGARRL